MAVENEREKKSHRSPKEAVANYNDTTRRIDEGVGRNSRVGRSFEDKLPRTGSKSGRGLPPYHRAIESTGCRKRQLTNRRVIESTERRKRQLTGQEWVD